MKPNKVGVVLLILALFTGGVALLGNATPMHNSIVSSSIDTNNNLMTTPKTIKIVTKKSLEDSGPEEKPQLFFTLSKTPLSFVKIEMKGNVALLTPPILDIGHYNIEFLGKDLEFSIGRDERYVNMSIAKCVSLEIKKESFRCLQNYFQDKVINEKTSIASINELTEAGQENVLLRGTDCHMWAHVIGYTQAMQSSDDYKKGFSSGSNSCQSGYVHGLVEGYAVIGDKEALKEMLPIFCQKYDPSFQANQGACLHSLGHMTWFRSGGDLNTALELCKFAGDKLAGTYTAKGFCASGVAMNWAYAYLAGNPEEKLELSYGKKEPTDVCKDLKDLDLREGCYGFITAVWGESMEGLNHMADICNSLSARDSKSCWLNLGSVQSLQSFSEEKNAIRFCFKAKTNVAFWLCQNNVVEEFTHIQFKSGTAEAVCRVVPKNTLGYKEECEKLIRLENFNLKNAKEINHLHIPDNDA